MPRGRRNSPKLGASSVIENPECKNFCTPVSPVKRRKKAQKSQPSSTLSELVPPPSSSSKNTIVAQNPFDDQPIQQAPSSTMQNKQMGLATSTMGQGPLASGKIYPPNQAMVFNTSNPNAPPIYPCGICHKEVHDNDHAILCESGCNFWFHRVCTGLTEPAFLMLTQEVYAEWVCNKCLQSKNIPLIKMKP